MAHIVSLAIDASLFLIGISVGLESGRAVTTFVVRHRGLLARSFVSMNVVMPAAAMLAASLFGLSFPVKAALVTLAVSPLPIHFPHKVSKAGIDDEYTVSLLLTMAVASIAVVPASIWLIGKIVGLPLGIAPLSVLRIVASDVLVPVGIGALVRWRVPDLSDRVVQGCMRLGTAILVLAIIPLIAVLLPSMIALVGNGSIIAIALFALVGLVVGHALGGANDSHRTVLAIATASRHPAVALAITRANFPDQNLAPAAILLDVLISTVIVTLYYRRPRASSALGGRSARHRSLNAERVR